MTRGFLFLFLALLLGQFSSGQAGSRLLHNGAEFPVFSVVAHDSLTGAMGILTVSGMVSGASFCQFGETGLLAGVCHGVPSDLIFPKIRESVSQDSTLSAAVRHYLTTDLAANFRQILFVDVGGNFSSRTGSDVKQYTAATIGREVSVAGCGLPFKIKAASLGALYRSLDTLDMAERLLETASRITLPAWRSASLVIWLKGAGPDGVGGQSHNLRVDASTEPLEEMSQLLKIHRAGEVARSALLATPVTGLALIEQAIQLDPDNRDYPYFKALLLVRTGKVADGRAILMELLPLSPLHVKEFAEDLSFPLEMRKEVISTLEQNRP